MLQPLPFTRRPLDAGGKADLVGSLTDLGVWVRYSETGLWERLNGLTADQIACGDLNGDGKTDLLGSWTHGVWWKDSGSGNWERIHDSADLVAAGDLNGLGKDDLIGVWPGVPGLWVRYSEDGIWERVHHVSPSWITAGRFGLAE